MVVGDCEGWGSRSRQGGIGSGKKSVWDMWMDGKGVLKERV